MSHLAKLNSISDLKQRFAALKSLANELTGQEEAHALCSELRDYFHKSDGSANWRKACLKTSVFIINKYKLQFSEKFDTDSEIQFVEELDHCASSKEQFLLLKSHIKLISKSQVKILGWIEANQDDEVISKVFTKLKPLIDSLVEQPIEETPAIEPEDVANSIDSLTPEPQESATVESEPYDTPVVPSIPETKTGLEVEHDATDQTQVLEPSTPVISDEPELPALDASIPELNDHPTEIDSPLTDVNHASSNEKTSEMPTMPEASDEIPEIPDVPDIPDEDEFLEDDADDLPAQFRSSNDPSNDEESDQSNFDPLHGRKKIIGADLPKPESPGAVWAALIMLVLPFALLFQAYSSAESQSFFSFLVTYFIGFIVIQSLIYVQKFLAGIKPDASWINCLIPTMPLYQKTNLGNPVCPQPLALICSVMIILALYAQPQVMAMHKKNMAAELAKAEAEAKSKQIRKVVTKALVKSKKSKVNKRKKQKARKRRKKAAKDSPPPLPEVNYADVQQEFMDRSDEIINAVYQYRLATMRKNSKAMSELGYMHDSAEGVKEDRVLAYTWYMLAVKHGDPDAQADAKSMKAQLTPKQLEKVEEYLKMELKKIPFTPAD